MKKKLANVLSHESANILFDILFISFALSVVVNFYNNILLATALLSVVSFIGLFKWKSKMTLILFFLVGILGTFAEIIAISYGVWFYPINNFINVPFWLFILWGDAAAFIYQISKEIKALGVRR